MEINETSKRKYSKIFLKEKETKILPKKEEKLIVLKKNHTWKRMSSFFKLQTYVQTNKNAKVKKKKYIFIILSI